MPCDDNTDIILNKILTETYDKGYDKGYADASAAFISLLRSSEKRVAEALKRGGQKS